MLNHVDGYEQSVLPKKIVRLNFLIVIVTVLDFMIIKLVSHYASVNMKKELDYSAYLSK